jgi:hypothetical protein
VTRLHAKVDVSGGQDVLACGEVACLALDALEVAAGRRGVARHDNRGGFRKDNLRDLAPIFPTLSGNFQIPGVFASFFRCHAGPSH